MSTSAEPVELRRAGRRRLTMVQPLAAERGVHAGRAAGAGHGAWVQADRKRLRQVLANLLSNAVKYNRRGGQRARSRSRRPPTGGACSRCTTPAAASRPAQLAQLYQPFQRFVRRGRGDRGHRHRPGDHAPPGRADGRHARRSSSEAGEGSVFRVALPRGRGAAARRCRAGTPLAVAARRRGRRARLLYVEDNPSNVELMRQVLALRPDLELEVAGDGRPAWRALRAGALRPGARRHRPAGHRRRRAVPPRCRPSRRHARAAAAGAERQRDAGRHPPRA